MEHDETERRREKEERGEIWRSAARRGAAGGHHHRSFRLAAVAVDAVVSMFLNSSLGRRLLARLLRRCRTRERERVGAGERSVSQRHAAV
jgi:hypothetical protein